MVLIRRLVRAGIPGSGLSGRWWFMSGLGFIRRMFWSCIGWCECCDVVA